MGRNGTVILYGMRKGVSQPSRKTTAMHWLNAISVVLCVVIAVMLEVRVKSLLFDVLLLSGSAIIIGVRCALFVRHAQMRSVIALVLLVAVIASAWISGIGVVHDVDVFYTKPTVFVVLLTGWTVGWLIASVGVHAFVGDEYRAEHRLQWNLRFHWPVGVVAAITVLFATLHLGGLSFQNDEYYHIEAAKGFTETGKPVLWDFAGNQPKISPETGQPIVYDRAFLYTAQVIASVNVFGWSEFSARIPAAGWYVLLAVFVYGVAYTATHRRDLAVLSSIGLVAMDHIMLYGRIVRMYSMTMVLALAMIVLFYLLYREWMQPALSAKRVTWYALALTATTVLASHIHLIALMLLPAFVVFLFSELLYASILKKAAYHPAAIRRLRLLLLCGGIGLAVALIGLALAQRAITEYFIGFRTGANTAYLFYPFQDMSIPVLGLALYVSSFIVAYRSRLMRYASILSLTVLYTFVYIVTRYSAPRYVSFILPLIVCMVLYVQYTVVRGIVSRWMPKSYAQWVAISMCFVSVVPIALPITSDALVMLQTPRYERTHTNVYGHNIPAAYTFIRSHIASNESLLTIDFRSYYWQDSDQEVIELPKKREMTLEVFLDLLEQHPRAWLVVPKGKMHHIKIAVQEYIGEHATEYTLPGTNVFIYHF